MKKRNKILFAVLAAVLVAGVAFYASNSELFQGRLYKISKITRCNVALENFAPNPGKVVKYGDAVTFKWNGPGCSKYDFTQYELCFKNVRNSQEFACIGVLPNSNNWTLSKTDWKFINDEMKNTSRSRVYTNWYVQSRFGNVFRGEILTTKPWRFSYTK